jgi:hypothetical protein
MKFDLSASEEYALKAVLNMAYGRHMARGESLAVICGDSAISDTSFLTLHSKVFNNKGVEEYMAAHGFYLENQRYIKKLPTGHTVIITGIEGLPMWPDEPITACLLTPNLDVVTETDHRNLVEFFNRRNF